MKFFLENETPKQITTSTDRQVYFCGEQIEQTQAQLFYAIAF